MWDIFGSVINQKKMKQSTKINSLLQEEIIVENNNKIIKTKKITDDQEIYNSINHFSVQ